MVVNNVFIVVHDVALMWCLEQICIDLGFETHLSSDGLHAMMRVRRVKPDLIILDTDVSIVGSLSVFELLAQEQRLSRVPIVVLINESDTRTIKLHQVHGTPMALKRSNGQDDLRSQLGLLLNPYVTSRATAC